MIASAPCRNFGICYIPKNLLPSGCLDSSRSNLLINHLLVRGSIVAVNELPVIDSFCQLPIFILVEVPADGPLGQSPEIPIEEVCEEIQRVWIGSLWSTDWHN